MELGTQAQTGSRERTDVRRVIVSGVIVNVLMAAVKAVVGMLSGSIALVADAVHSFSDLLTDIVAALGTRFGTLPADRTHPYGHGKIETLASLAIGAILVGVGAKIGWEAALAVYQRQHSYPGVEVLFVAALSVALKEVLYRITRTVAIRYGSTALYANAWHHRSDALSSVAVIAGGIGALLGWGHADQVAGMIVGAMVAVVGIKICHDALVELAEASIPRQAVAAVEEVLASEPDIAGWHRLRTRRAGREIFIDVHVLVKPDLTVLEGHAISDRVSNAVRRVLDRPASILVHVEPDTPELRDPRSDSPHSTTGD